MKNYENYLKSTLGSVSCCEVTLRRTAYWLLECRHVILRKKNDPRSWYHVRRLVKRFLHGKI